MFFRASIAALFSVTLFFSCDRIDSASKDAKETGAGDGGGETVSPPADPVKPLDSCTKDVNEWGHPGQCECPEGYDYRQESGDCRQPGSAGQTGSAGSALACTQDSDCVMRTVDCSLQAVHKDEPPASSQQSCNKPDVEPSWNDQDRVSDALCVASQCQAKARTWVTLPGVTEVKIAGQQQDVEVSFTATVEYCSDKPEIRFYTDSGENNDECGLYIEQAKSPFDTCEALKTEEVSFKKKKYGICDLTKAKAPDHPDLDIVKE